MPQKAVIYMYVYRQDILMNNRPNSIILLHKTGAHCIVGKLLIFKNPQIRIWSLCLKCRIESVHRLVYKLKVK